MGDTAAIRSDTGRGADSAGLIVAIALHAGLVALLLLQPPVREQLVINPAPMSVNLGTEVSLVDTAPDPVPESRAAIAPTPGESPAPDAAAPAPADASPLAPVTPPAPPVPSARTAPSPTPPAPTATRRTATQAPSRDRSRPDRTAAPPRAAPTPARNAPQGGGSRIGEDFLSGGGNSTTTSETRLPASQIGPSAKASLLQAISRRIRPHWQPPNGADVDQLRSFVRFRLNPDGSLAGTPQLVRQTGVNDTNRPQAARHGELAVRAVQRAGRFDDLPPEFYEAWKIVGPLEFNWELAQ